MTDTSRDRLIEVAAEADYNEATKSADPRSSWEDAPDATRAVWRQMVTPIVDAILAEQAKTQADIDAFDENVVLRERREASARAFDRMRERLAHDYTQATDGKLTGAYILGILDAYREEIVG